MKENFNNLRINKFLNTIINDLWNIQKRLSFVGIERTVKKLATGSFYMFAVCEMYMKIGFRVFWKLC